MAGYTDPEIAFAYIHGHVYYGSNHVEILKKLGLLSDLDTAHAITPPSAFGWIWNSDDGTQTAEFYSDHYENAQDSLIFDEVYKRLKEDFPKLSELSFGPSDELIEEMSKAYADLDQWSEQAEDWDLPTPSHLKVSFKWSKETGLKIV